MNCYLFSLSKQQIIIQIGTIIISIITNKNECEVIAISDNASFNATDTTMLLSSLIGLCNSSSDTQTLPTDLSNLLSCDNVILDGLQTLVEGVNQEVKRKKILSQYQIKQFQTGLNAGKYYVKIDGKKHQSVSKSSLEKIILEIHGGMLLKTDTTFKAIFFKSQDYRLSIIKDPNRLVSSSHTVDIQKRNYKRFVEGTFLESKQIDEITKRDITNLVDFNLQRYDLKKQAFKNMKTVLNKAFNYALKLDLIDMNPMLSVYWDDYKECFAPSAPIKERGYTHEEMAAMYDYARQMQLLNPEDTRWWSYEFNLLTALRRAEIPPLTWNDVYLEKGFIDIHQELVGTKKPYVIKPSTKTDRDRYFPITAAITEFLTRLSENNNQYHPGSIFLFPDENEDLGCITTNVTYRAHKKACDNLGIGIDKTLPKGTHAFRRVHETSFLENGGSLDLAAKVYGNSPKVIEANYLLSVNAQSSAPVIDLTQQKLFKNIAENYNQIQKSCLNAVYPLQVNAVNAKKLQ